MLVGSLLILVLYDEYFGECGSHDASRHVDLPSRSQQQLTTGILACCIVSCFMFFESLFWGFLLVVLA